MHATRNTSPAEAEYEPWDPSSPAQAGRFLALAGEQLDRVEGDIAWTRTENGPLVPCYPGWVAARRLPGGPVRFMTPEAFAEDWDA